MKRRTSLFAQLALPAILFGAAPATGFALDREFGAVVHHVESYYNAHRNHSFVLWFAGMVVKFWHPYGVNSLRLAVFEEQDFSASRNDEKFNEILRKKLRPEWQPIVRVYSRRTGERSYIYAAERGDDIEFFIVTLEENEAVVMKVKLDPAKMDLDQRLEHPQNFGKSFAGRSKE